MSRTPIAIPIAVLLTTSLALAQIIIDSREVPNSVGLQFQYYSQSSDSIPVNVGVPGGPQTWNYTQGDTSLISTDLYLDPQTSPPQYARANVVIQTDELNFAGLNEPGKMYCYLHPSRFILGAIETTYEGSTFDFMFTPYVNQYTLPLQMGSSWTNTINIDEIFEFPDYDIRLELYATMNSQVDAFGTVSVPLGDVEALRTRNDVTYDLTVYIRFLWIWVPIYQDAGEGINYTWRAENVGSVLSITSDTADPYFSYAKSVRRLMNSNSTLAVESAFTSPTAGIPESAEIIANYPNPFNSETIISFELQDDLNVDLRVYDMMGRQVADFEPGFLSQGAHEVRWVPMDLPSGVYIVRLSAGQELRQHMLVYLK